jgi:hypothetical protein
MEGPGRPTVMTEETLRLLREAFLLDCTDEEACFYAKISPSTFYLYQSENPKYLEEKRGYKQNPFLLARKSVIEGFSNPDLALKYLERKKKDEFSLRNELTGRDGKDLPTPILANVSKDDSYKEDTSSE